MVIRGAKVSKPFLFLLELSLFFLQAHLGSRCCSTRGLRCCCGTRKPEAALPNAHVQAQAQEPIPKPFLFLLDLSLFFLQAQVAAQPGDRAAAEPGSRTAKRPCPGPGAGANPQALPVFARPLSLFFCRRISEAALLLNPETALLLRNPEAALPNAHVQVQAQEPIPKPFLFLLDLPD
jgi:hypothetical protein